MTGTQLLTIALLSQFALPSIANTSPNNRLHKAIQSGEKFLSQSVQTNTYSMECESNNKTACPTHKTGEILTGFYIAQALSNNGRIPENIRDQLIVMLTSSKKIVNSSTYFWGYSAKVQEDSDDTSFALQTLLLLGEPVSLSGLNTFYISNIQAYSTFKPSADLPPTLTEPSMQGNSGIHPEVNANIFILLQRLKLASKINYNLVKALQSSAGYWRSFFYVGKYYSTYTNMKVLCTGKQGVNEVKKGLAFITTAQNDDGSWGAPASAYDTALALNTLMACDYPVSDTLHKGIQSLIKSQTKDGFWKTTQAIWKFTASRRPLIVWTSYDSHHVLTSALALQALKKYKEITEITVSDSSEKIKHKAGPNVMLRSIP